MGRRKTPKPRIIICKVPSTPGAETISDPSMTRAERIYSAESMTGAKIIKDQTRRDLNQDERQKFAKMTMMPESLFKDIDGKYSVEDALAKVPFVEELNSLLVKETLGITNESLFGDSANEPSKTYNHEENLPR